MAKRTRSQRKRPGPATSSPAPDAAAASTPPAERQRTAVRAPALPVAPRGRFWLDFEVSWASWALFRLWEKGRFSDLWLRYFPVNPF